MNEMRTVVFICPEYKIQFYATYRREGEFVTCRWCFHRWQPVSKDWFEGQPINWDDVCKGGCENCPKT